MRPRPMARPPCRQQPPSHGHSDSHLPKSRCGHSTGREGQGLQVGGSDSLRPARRALCKTGLKPYKNNPHFRAQEWAGNTFCYLAGGVNATHAIREAQAQAYSIALAVRAVHHDILLFASFDSLGVGCLGGASI